MCNTNLPTNAINNKDLKPGMKFYSESGATMLVNGSWELQPSDVVYTFEHVSIDGRVTTDKGLLNFGRNWKAGSVRLAEYEPGYDYHADHDCKAEVRE